MVINLLVRGSRFCLFLRFFYWILELFPKCDICCYHFIIHFPDEPDVRIESADTIVISEGQTLTLKCSFDFGTGLLNVKWIHNYKIEIKGLYTIDSNSSYLTNQNINHTFSGPWECKVQNEVGFGSDFVHINVKCEYD